MNIHFKDEKLFEQLKLATIVKVKVGSHLYGTANMYGTSDEDYLYIYVTSENELKSFIWTNHQLQYKEDGIDHNFVSVHSFIRNCLNGDSTINFEVIQSDELIGTELEFLTHNKKAFHTYTIIRSYCGFVKRDFKHWFKTKTREEERKKLGHIARGFIYAYELIKNRFDFNSCNEELKNLINKFDSDFYNSAKCYAETAEKLRKELNNNTLGLAKIIRTDDAKIINDQLLELVNSDYFKDKQSYIEDFDMNYFINAFENWVEYEK